MDLKAITKYGGILTIVLIGYFLTTNLIGVSGNSAIGWLTYIFYAFVIFYGLSKSRETLESYREKFLFGVLVSAIGAILSSIFMFIYLKFVDDLMIRTAIANEIGNLDSNSATYEQTVEALKTAITPAFYLLFGMISGTVIGSILSLLMPLTIKKVKKE